MRGRAGAKLQHGAPREVRYRRQGCRWRAAVFKVKFLVQFSPLVLSGTKCQRRPGRGAHAAAAFKFPPLSLPDTCLNQYLPLRSRGECARLSTQRFSNPLKSTQ